MADDAAAPDGELSKSAATEETGRHRAGIGR